MGHDQVAHESRQVQECISDFHGDACTACCGMSCTAAVLEVKCAWAACHQYRHAKHQMQGTVCCCHLSYVHANCCNEDEACRKAMPFRKSRGCIKPAVGRMDHPVAYCRASFISCSCGGRSSLKLSASYLHVRKLPSLMASVLARVQSDADRIEHTRFDVLFASPLRDATSQMLQNCGPGLNFLWGVDYIWDRLAAACTQGS